MFSFNLISVLRTKHKKSESIDLLFNIVFILLIIISVVSSESKAIKNMETIEFNSDPLFRVIVNRLNNDIIIGGRNGIYKVSSNNLQSSQEFRSGPVNDSRECPPPPLDCVHNKKLVDNDNQILLINYQAKDFPLLFACGDAHQGICWVFNAENLTWAKQYGQGNNSLNFLGSKSSSYAFIAPSSDSSKNVVYVAHEYDGRPLNMSPPAVSSRAMMGYGG